MVPHVEKHIESVKRTIRAFFPVRPGGILQNFDRENPELCIKFDDPTGREPGFIERIQLRNLYGQVDVIYSPYPPNIQAFPKNWDRMIWIDTNDPARLELKVYSALVGDYIPLEFIGKTEVNSENFFYNENGELELGPVDGGEF